MTATENNPPKDSIYRLGEIVFSPASRVLQAPDGRTVIEPRMADVLWRLIANRGPVTRHDLLDDVWGEDGSDEALTQVVSRLRRVMGDKQRPYKIILTVPRGGYELGLSPEQIAVMPALVEPGSPSRTRSWISRNKNFLLGYAAGIITCLLFAAWWIVTHPPVQVEQDVFCSPGSTEPDCQVSGQAPPLEPGT